VPSFSNGELGILGPLDCGAIRRKVATGLELLDLHDLVDLVDLAELYDLIA
jgi:hypothetical protein